MRRDDVRNSYRQADARRVYHKEHPLALWFALGIFIVGLVALVVPSTVEETATSTALPLWLRHLFYLSYAIGGFTMWWGLHRMWFKLEAAGEVILATALLAQYLAILYVRPIGGISGLFVLTLSIGCARRAWSLIERPPSYGQGGSDVDARRN